MKTKRNIYVSDDFQVNFPSFYALLQQICLLGARKWHEIASLPVFLDLVQKDMERPKRQRRLHDSIGLVVQHEKTTVFKRFPNVHTLPSLLCFLDGLMTPDANWGCVACKYVALQPVSFIFRYVQDSSRNAFYIRSVRRNNETTNTVHVFRSIPSPMGTPKRVTVTRKMGHVAL